MPNRVLTGTDMRVHDVFEVLRHLRYERAPHRPRRCDVRKVLDDRLAGTGGPDLATAEGRRQLTQAVVHPNDLVRGAPLRSTARVAMALKVALAIDDVLAGRWRLVPDEDFVRLLESLGFGVPPGRPGLPVADGTSPDGATASSVEFSFPWRPRTKGTAQRIGTATACAGISALDASDAPVACSLWTPDGHLDVRRHGEAWLRPILSPGTWEPITLERFRRAVADGAAWRDSPFLPGTGRGRPTFHLSDYAFPRPAAEGDAARIAEARDACLARAGWLCVIDGIVHRTAEEPLAGFVVTFLDDEVSYGPAWSLGALDSTCSMRTLECHEGFGVRWPGGEAKPTADAPTVRSGLVAVADWVAVVDLLPADLPWREPGGTGRWPSPRNLVRLGDAVRGSGDGHASLRAAARLSDQALSMSWGRTRRVSPQDGLTRLHHHLGLLRDVDLRPDDRATVLSRTGPICRRVSEVLSGSADPGRHLWACVVALATHGARCETERRVEVEDLVDVRL